MKDWDKIDRLALSKETIASLSEEQLQEIEGGQAGATDFGGTSCINMTCNTATVSDVHESTERV